jgi:TonB family protein
MKRTWFHFIVSAVLFSSLAGAQSPDQTVGRPGPEDGTVVNKTYANAYLGFAYPIPDGWEVSRDAGSEWDGKAHRFPSGGLELLIVDRYTGSFRNRILVSALDATGFSTTTGGFVSRIARGPINETGGEIVREPFAVTFAGQPFFRADYKQTLNGGTRWGTFICTKLRGYFLGWMFVASSPGELEGFVRSLQRLSFFADKPGAAGGIGDSSPGTAESNAGQPLRVRVSQAVSTDLLLTKVQPQYPESARQARIQGSVVLKAVIDKNGGVEELTLVSGHPLLAPAALEAVKQWKYKPYLLNGQAVKVETQIVVNFQFSGH